MRYSKVYKFLNGYPLDIMMNEVFHFRQNTFNLQNFYAFAQLRRIHGKSTIKCLPL